MLRKDKILNSFLDHEVLKTEYGLNLDDLPITIRDALNSDKPIVKAIALIIEGLEKSPSQTDNELKNTILQYLNSIL
jgi:hypothetical protein